MLDPNLCECHKVQFDILFSSVFDSENYSCINLISQKLSVILFIVNYYQVALFAEIIIELHHHVGSNYSKLGALASMLIDKACYSIFF